MPPFLKISGIAAIINAVLAFTSLIVAFVLIGAPTLTDNARLVQMAIENPAPLILQDLLKLATAVTAIVLVGALFIRLRSASAGVMGWATLFGILSILFLFANAGLSLYAVSQGVDLAQAKGEPGARLNGIIGLLGMAVIALNGLWYLPVSWVALKSNRLPRWLCYLGLAMGGLSLFPPLGIIVLLMSIPWAFGLGRTLLSEYCKFCENLA